MSESLDQDIVEQSAEFDVQGWLTGAKSRTKTVMISNDPDLAEEVNTLVVELNIIRAKIEARQDDEGSAADESIAEDGTEGLRELWFQKDEEYQALLAEYEASKRPFTFRATKPSDGPRGEAAMKRQKVPDNPVSISVFNTSWLMTSPTMSYQQLSEALEDLGSIALGQMTECWTSLMKKKSEPSAPLSLRP